MRVGAGVEKQMSSIWKQFMQQTLADLNRSRVAGFDSLGDIGDLSFERYPPEVTPDARAKAEQTLQMQTAL